ncbi:hypothetical protein GQ457_16G017930 [Hibiscus cannabinus]
MSVGPETKTRVCPIRPVDPICDPVLLAVETDHLLNPDHPDLLSLVSRLLPIPERSALIRLACTCVLWTRVNATIMDTVLGELYTKYEPSVPVSTSALVDSFPLMDPPVAVDPSTVRGPFVLSHPPSSSTPGVATTISGASTSTRVDRDQSRRPFVPSSSSRPDKRTRMTMRCNSEFAHVTSPTPIVSRDVLSGFTLLPVCVYCEKRHGGECRKKLGVCFHCGTRDHFLRECPHSLSVAHALAPAPAPSPTPAMARRHYRASRSVIGTFIEYSALHFTYVCKDSALVSKYTYLFNIPDNVYFAYYVLFMPFSVMVPSNSCNLRSLS